MPKVKYVCVCSLVCVCFQGDLNLRTYLKKIIQYNVSLQNRKFQNVRYISQDCVCVSVFGCACACMSVGECQGRDESGEPLP